MGISGMIWGVLDESTPPLSLKHQEVQYSSVVSGRRNIYAYVHIPMIIQTCIS